MFTEIFSKNSSLNDLDIYLLAFPSRTDPKLHKIPVTLKFVSNVIIIIRPFFSKAYNVDSILVVVLKNCEPEPTYMIF